MKIMKQKLASLMVVGGLMVLTPRSELFAGATCETDFDFNGSTDASDLAFVLAAYGLTGEHVADVTGNHVVDNEDVEAVLANYGPCERQCPEDLDFDGEVNSVDMQILLGQFTHGKKLKGDHPADLNKDQSIDSRDLAELLAAWGPCVRQDNTCTQAATFRGGEKKLQDDLSKAFPSRGSRPSRGPGALQR